MAGRGSVGWLIAIWTTTIQFSLRTCGCPADECAPLGKHFLHLSVGYGSPLRFMDRAAVGNPAVQRSLEEGKLPFLT